MSSELQDILFSADSDTVDMADFEVYLNCVSPESSSSLRHISEAARDYRQLQSQLANKQEPAFIDWDLNETDNQPIRRYHQPRRSISIS